MLNYLRHKGSTEAVKKLRKRTACNGDLLSDVHSLFSQFQRIIPSQIMSNLPANPRNDDSASRAVYEINKSPPVSSRARSKTNQSQPLALTIHDIIQPEYHCVLDSAFPVKKHFTDTLVSKHASCWKLEKFEHFDQNTDTVLCYILLPISQVLDQWKTNEPVLVPNVKPYYELPNHCDLKIRWRQNRNVDASYKSIRKF